MSNFDICLLFFIILSFFGLGVLLGINVNIDRIDYKVNLKQDTEYQKGWVEVNGVDMPLDSLKNFIIRGYE